ncbi:MAG: LssY C-terminal domain-containing protein [Syntrophobacteria bacterium]
MRRSAYIFLLSIWIISALIISGCAATYHPGSIHDVGFRERAQSKSDEDVRVTVAVLSAEESKELFGVDLARKNIQPVWVRVENHDTRPYWLSSSGLDSGYFSPLETAYAYHAGYSKTTKEEIDDYFLHMKFKNPIVSNAAVSGFVFTNRDEGMKVVDIDLIGYEKAKFFTFVVPVPGIKADYHEVDFDKLYSEEEIVDLDEDGLRRALEELPCCTTNEDGTQKGDPLNLVLIGSHEDITAAFVRRRWLPAEQTYGKAVVKTIKSFLFGSRYRYSPVSPLYLYKRQQDFAGQKPRHTVHQRNHLRAWLSPMRFEGKQVWIGQISRDIGVRFTTKTWPPVTHKIDPDVDEALYALLEDLVYSQQVEKQGWVKGVDASTRSNPRKNLTGDPYFTAGFRAVLMFVRRPHSLKELQWLDWDEGPISYKIERLETNRQQDFDEQ